MTCPKCGKEIADDLRFCGYCGAPLEGAQKEPEFEEPQRMAEAAEEPELEVSRETIAQFDEYVKSFEKEAGIISEPDFPEFEEPEVAQPAYEAPKFELPDFLKKVTSYHAKKNVIGCSL